MNGGFMAARWEFTKGKGKQPYRARLLAENGRILCWTEGYSRDRARVKAVKSIMRACGSAVAKVVILDDPKRRTEAKVSKNKFDVYRSILV
jgi:uncharacterized protein YegP (UPF0339 family)